MKIDAPNTSVNARSINDLLKNLLNSFSSKKKTQALKFTRVTEKFDAKRNYLIRDGF